MDRYLCIHGHFYQPPRENPWLEAIELQDSAYPYHDWNERITGECYEPNGASRILDGNGNIARIVNNYSRISFNFGPTLLSWLETEAPEAYRAILEADRASRERFSGHGSAMAQPYNHMIMPLANRRDRETQVKWGIVDFQHRFGRDPEGMWLPECAVDLETLELLAARGIRFTVLSPHQAGRVRPPGGRWRSVAGGRIDPSMPYRQPLPSGRTIDLFFYDGPVSQAVAFERLLGNGEVFANRLIGGFSDRRARPQLMHIATDGETYGHHHRHGDMALAWALDFIERRELARLTNYAEFLDRHPPTHEVQIIENTSWSCLHGLDRWRSDCGCDSGGRPEWNQQWRAPLRAAFDALRDELDGLYDERGRGLFADPGRAIDGYIEAILDRTPRTVDRFLDEQARAPLSPEQRIECLRLLEMRRHAMLMYTSCGWFFDDLSGIETVQVIQYAGRAVQLAGILLPNGIEDRFLERLSAARSNIPEHGDGRRIFETRIGPTRLDLIRVGGHYAVRSLFEEYPEKARIFCYEAERDAAGRREAGRMRLIMGRARIASAITRESTEVSYAALHIGDHNVSGGAREFLGSEAYRKAEEEILATFERAEIPAVLQQFERHFGGRTFSLRSLFRDEQRKILGIVLEPILEEADSSHLRVYERNIPMIQFLARIGMPLPRALHVAAERALNLQLQRTLESPRFDPDRVGQLLGEARDRAIHVDGETLEFAFRRHMEVLAVRFAKDPGNLECARELDAMVDFIPSLPFDVTLRRVQNRFYGLVGKVYPGLSQRAGAGEPAAREWVDLFLSLGRRLHVSVD